MKWIKKLPTIINGNGDVKRKDYVKSFAEKCVEDHLPRQPSDKDYGRLIKAYGLTEYYVTNFMASYYFF